ncbi:hypothetical protein PoB_000092000 [Plakobranchus ocellatus]|uniref:Uncharacterized protein n=1 Tax=Plakobranchus ocellatus TaxID=259542 RepID=A0AAV3XUU3_9GAST|nr:hypothetical protein PoB_000092000 [Plakobranchus ocellatus]
MVCIARKEHFLANPNNKQAFVQCLGDVLEKDGCQVPMHKGMQIPSSSGLRFHVQSTKLQSSSGKTLICLCCCYTMQIYAAGQTGLTQLAICSLRCGDGSYLLADWIHAQRSSTCSRASVEDDPVQLQVRLSVKALHVQKTWT